MASVSLFLMGFLLLAFGHEGIISLKHNSSDGGEIEMEQEELFGLFEVMGSILDDPSWAQIHPQPCNETPWPGVQCEVSEEQQNPPIFHVTSIHIGPDILTPPCKKSAKISLSLLKLPYLKTLSLFNCFTSSPFSLSPSLFGAFSSLEHLALGSNPSLYGEIPQTLAHISTLRVLSLSQNNFQGKIPKNIDGLTNLEQLDLSYNNLSGSMPEGIGELKKLTILDLSWNGLEGPIPCSLGQLHLLQKIDLCSNKLKGEVPSTLGQLNSLVFLDLSHNLLTGPFAETLSGLQNLEYLMFENNPINTGVPCFLGSLKKLMVLSFSGCGLSGPVPNFLSDLKNLTALSLDNNSLNGTLPSNLGSLSNLGQLNLSYNQLSGEINLSEKFIARLGKRLDLIRNNGLCFNQETYKEKNIFASLGAPPCLGTRASGENSSRSEMPIWGYERESSSTGRIHLKLGMRCFVVWFITFSL